MCEFNTPCPPGCTGTVDTTRSYSPGSTAAQRRNDNRQYATPGQLRDLIRSVLGSKAAKMYAGATENNNGVGRKK